MGIEKTFHIGVKAVITKKGKALILQEVSRKGDKSWSLPGGRIDEGESIEEALKRELREELGVKNSKIESLINVFERLDYKKNVNLMLIVYKVKASIAKIKLSDEHAGYRWVTKAELKKMVKDKEEINPGIVKSISLVI